MIKLAAFSFALVFFFKPALPLLEYVVNYDFIINELCINKDNENLDCNGTCHLKKELAKAADQSESTPTDGKLKYPGSEILFIDRTYGFDLHRPSDPNHVPTDTYSNLYRYSQNLSFFHPPALI